MQETDIKDTDIPGADPAAVVQQYEPFIRKLANRYTAILERSGAVGLDDLHQVGRIAVLKAQKTYNPDCGFSFMRCLFYEIRRHMRNALGINPNTGAAPERLVYLDEPLPGIENEELTRLDMIADPTAVPMDEPIIEEETQRETSNQVRAALNRMKSDKQRTAVSLIWMEGKNREQAAAAMGMQTGSFYALEKNGRSTLRRDGELREYAMKIPSFHVGLDKFKRTFTSEVEATVIWKDEHSPDYISKQEAFQEEASRI